MSTQEIHVPDIGDFTDVDIIEVLVSPGDTVAEEDPLITLESDKASMDVPSPAAGTVAEVKVKVGDKVSEGDLIILMETTEAPAAAPAAPVPAAAQSERVVPSATAPAPSAPARGEIVSFARVHASPTVRRIARERKIDLNRVQGTGAKGRITKSDVNAFVEGRQPAASAAGVGAAGGAGIPPIPAQDFSKFGAVETLPLNKIKRLTGANLSRAWLNVPHVTHNDETDITELEGFRQALKPRAEKAGVRVTLLSFFMKALAMTLKEFPTFNASLDAGGENLILKKYYNIGIAVDTPDGLVVPVIRDVDQKGLFALSADLMEMSSKAREKKLKTTDMQGASMTISSLGGIGGTSFTPIVNAPEVAILGLTRSQEKPLRGKDDGIVWRLMQPMSLSYDHRVVDGAEAARFTRHLGEMVNDIRLLLT